MALLKYSVALAAVALTAMSTADAADRVAREWLERMSESLATRNYEGRFLHVRDSRSETMRIIHRVDKGKVSERLVSLDGSGREIIRNENEVDLLSAGQTHGAGREAHRTTHAVGSSADLQRELEAHYSIESGAVTKTLGRRTQMILVQPRDQYRYGYRLWLDEETAMPLKSQLCDRNGSVIEQILFAELNLRDRIPADAQAGDLGEGFRWVRQDAQEPRMASAPLGWNVIRLPAGFA